MLTATVDACLRAMDMSDMWPACNAPIVGTRASSSILARALRASAMVVMSFMQIRLHSVLASFHHRPRMREIVHDHRDGNLQCGMNDVWCNLGQGFDHESPLVHQGLLHDQR